MTATVAPTQSTPSDLLADFKKLGFTEYEARVYIQLLRQSPATAYEIAKSSGVPRPNTYNALEALSQRGAVLPVSENPVRYVAAPPERHLDQIGRRTLAVCDNLARRLNEIRPYAADPYVWIVKGETAVHEKIDALIGESTRSIRIKASDDVLRLHAGALRAAAARGVEILIVLFGHDPAEFKFSESCRVYLHEGNGVRMGTADNLFTLTIDHLEMLTASIEDEMTASYTRNRSVVRMAELLLRHDYYMAEIYGQFGPQIDAAFGPYLRDLRLSTFSFEEAMSFREKTRMR